MSENVFYLKFIVVLFILTFLNMDYSRSIPTLPLVFSVYVYGSFRFGYKFLFVFMKSMFLRRSLIIQFLFIDGAVDNLMSILTCCFWTTFYFASSGLRLKLPIDIKSLKFFLLISPLPRVLEFLSDLFGENGYVLTVLGDKEVPIEIGNCFNLLLS